MGELISKPKVSPGDVVNEVRAFYAALSPRDKALFDFAKFQVAKEIMDETEVYIQFEHHRDPLKILPSGCRQSDIKSQMFIAYDDTGRPKMTMFHHSFERSVPANIIMGVGAAVLLFILHGIKN